LYSNTTYDFGFNGKEKLDEIHGNSGDEYDFGARIYDARLGRFLSLDPRERDYAWQTPYAYYKNSPISQLDLDGRGGNPNDGTGGFATGQKANIVSTSTTYGTNFGTGKPAPQPTAPAKKPATPTKIPNAVTSRKVDTSVGSGTQTNSTNNTGNTTAVSGNGTTGANGATGTNETNDISTTITVTSGNTTIVELPESYGDVYRVDYNVSDQVGTQKGVNANGTIVDGVLVSKDVSVNSGPLRVTVGSNNGGTTTISAALPVPNGGNMRYGLGMSANGIETISATYRNSNGTGCTTTISIRPGWGTVIGLGIVGLCIVDPAFIPAAAGAAQAATQ
jgi:RHS repeat-associated protein